MTTKTTLRERLEQYLAMRRSLGFQLDDIERQVGLFCTWLEARGQVQTFTIHDAVAWARLNPDAHPSWWATRLSLVRRFAAYLNANGVEVPVIPSGLLPAKKPRAVPFIYSQDDVDALLAACDFEFADERVAVTVRTVIGLLAATGLRIAGAQPGQDAHYPWAYRCGEIPRLRDHRPARRPQDHQRSPVGQREDRPTRSPGRDHLQKRPVHTAR
jgi:site-specific recombinase XerD